MAIVLDGNNSSSTGLINSTSVVNTTSGLYTEIASIPAGVKRVIVAMNGISLSASANPLIQLGAAGSIVTSGYAGGVAQAGTTSANATSTVGLQLSSSSVAASTHSGIATLINIGGNTWVCVSTMIRSDGYSEQGGTVITLSAALDRVRLTTTNGTDTYDAGSVSLQYE
jgi:hypothetical protein